MSVEVSPGHIWDRVLYGFSPIEELGCFLNFLLDRVAKCVGGLRFSQSVNLLLAFSDVHCEPGVGELYKSTGAVGFYTTSSFSIATKWQMAPWFT